MHIKQPSYSLFTGKQSSALFILCLIFFVSLLFFLETAEAQLTSGLHNPVFGASGLAQGNAFTARANDASAIQFNPAGLTQIKKSEISQGANFVTPFAEYHGYGTSEDLDTMIHIIPDIYFASPLIEDKLAAGIGITVPYGLEGKWKDDGFSRYVVTDYSLRIININPAITYKPVPFLSVGAGLDYYYAESEIDKRINVDAINSSLTGDATDNNAPDGSHSLDMDGDAFGYNIGMLCTITPRHSAGISFRSKADIDFDGKLRISGLRGASADIFGLDTFRSRATTMATLPEMVTFGYAYNHDNRWSIEADVQWTNWSRFDILEFDFKPTNALLESNKEDIRNWHNVLGFALGGEYKMNERLKVRGGYSFHESPVPAETFEPSVPHSSRHGLFTGFGYDWGKGLNKGIDFAYGAVFYENREVDNSVGDAMQGPIDGHYDLITHIVAVNFNYRF